MQEIDKADITARRKALAVVLAGVVAGALLIAGLDHYREALQDWLLDDPDRFRQRLTAVFLLFAFLLSTPLICLAGYVWLLGARAIKSERFPPPGLQVVRDTKVLRGHDAILRGRLLIVLGTCLGVCAAVLCLLFWQIVQAM